MERIIPVFLIKNKELIKTTRFKKPIYVGDPLNTLRIFNTKEADEIILLDIMSSRMRTPPDIAYISMLATECFMPLAYGGGIRTLDDASRVFDCGVEKISLNTIVNDNPALITKIAGKYGSQSVIVSIDARKTVSGRYSVFRENGRKNIHTAAAQYALMAQENGAGEILLTSIEREGTGKGYDLELIKNVSSAIKIPLIACGGAKTINDFKLAVGSGAAAAAAGSIFFFTGSLRAVLVSYPTRSLGT